MCQGQAVVDISSTALLAEVAGDGGHHRRSEDGVHDRLLHDVSHWDDDVVLTGRRSRRAGYGHDDADGRIAMWRRWQRGERR
jgi:hypothetical protein